MQRKIGICALFHEYSLPIRIASIDTSHLRIMLTGLIMGLLLNPPPLGPLTLVAPLTLIMPPCCPAVLYGDGDAAMQRWGARHVPPESLGPALSHGVV